ncbi:DUF3068 domain-containing protein [Actinomadura darangshiensis]|uniref:DUF3068 domain-containing protein n=1 Tax=Actinomadura darangshiensis TaxID=705336 RepID=A0A4R5B8S8_9ACTN|nr:DUF3068 domain-containing protein [Actinomadura darangshiensis]TDD82718.1 DUF3068 domain-containing protein [Actinomadura darangshiensis]
MRRIFGASLIGLGAFLLAAGVLTRLYVAPTLIGAPTDVYQVTRLKAENASYLDAATAAPRTGATVVATNTVRGDPGSTHDGVAVWDSGTIVQDAVRGTTIEVQKQRYAFDRRTGELRNCCGSAVQGDTGVRQSGIGLFWPVHVRTKGLELFDTATRRTWPVSFDGKERVGGVLTYRFVQHVPETKVAGELPAVPPELLGRPKGGAAVPVDRYYRADATYWVDPRTGAPVDQRQKVLSTLRPKEGPGGLVVADFTLRMTPESRKALLAKSGDGAGKIRLLRTTGPLAGGAAGLLLVAAGLPLTLRAGRRTRRHRAGGGPVPRRAAGPRTDG